MGRYGGAILTIVGTVVGAYFGNPGLGAFLGSLVGSLAFPPTIPGTVGPRLADITSTNSQTGGAVPKGWGTFPAGGMVIAQSNIREHSDTQDVGGKGGASQQQTTFTYFQDFAIAVNGDNIYGGGEIAGIRRIWANGKPVFDRRPQQFDESDGQFDARMAANTKLEAGMSIYLGTETQDVDPTLEAFYGPNNISAFRGIAYVVFANWLLKDEDGRRMPSQWKFECFTSGTIHAGDTVEYSQAFLYPWLTGPDPRNPNNVHDYRCARQGSDSSGLDTFTVYDNLVPIFTDANSRPIAGGRDFSGLLSGGYGDENGDFTHPTLAGYSPMDQHPRTSYTYLHFNAYTFTQVFLNAIDDPVHHFDCSFNLGLLAVPGSQFWQDSKIRQVTACPGSNDLFCGNPLPGTGGDGWDTGSRCGGDAFWWRDSEDLIVECRRYPGAPPDPCAGRPGIPDIDGFCVLSNGTIEQAGPWILDTSQNYHALRPYVVWKVLDNGTTPANISPLGPVRPVGHAEDIQSFWDAAYAAAVAAGTMAAHLTYGADYPKVQSYGYKRALDKTFIDTDDANLAIVCADTLRASGLTDGQFDVSDIAALTVRGVVRSNLMTGRSLFDPLRQAAFFDVFESEFMLKFRRRGQPISRTLSLDELGAHYATDSADATSKLTTDKAQDQDLPRRIFVQYLSIERDLEANQQPSPARIETTAVNDVNLQLPIVLSDDQAAKIAEVLWADAWMSRWTHAFTLDINSIELEAADCIEVPVDGFLQRVRITDITDSLPNVRKYNALRDDDGTYESHAVAAPTMYVPPTINIAGPIEALLLDLPMLRDADDDPGVYAALRGYLAGISFPGASLYRSVDQGANFVKVADVATQATMGVLVSGLPAGNPFVFNDGDVLTVDLDNGALEGRTDTAVMAGANAAVIGADGRWEVLQFGTPTNTTGSRWELRHLLRGRRGTEHVMGSSVAGDRFVLIAGFARVPVDQAQIGVDLVYRSVSVGASFGSGIDQTFAGHAEALKPFSPVDLVMDNAPDGKLTLTWQRRDRIGQELPDGADIPMSEATELYAVEIYDAANTTLVRTYNPQGPMQVYSVADQIVDHGFVLSPGTLVNFKVYQVSAIVGRGYPGVFSGRVGGVPPPPPVTRSVTIEFGGVFDSANDITVNITFTPDNGTIPVVLALVVLGAGKASTADYATDLKSQVDASALHLLVATDATGGIFSLSSTLGGFACTVANHWPFSVVTQFQPSGPATAGRGGASYTDFWDASQDQLSPVSSGAYSINALYTKTIKLFASDIVEQTRISRLQGPPVPAGLFEGDISNAGYVVDVSWDASTAHTNYLSALAGLVDALNADPNFRSVFGGNAHLGTLTGTLDGAQLRNAVVIQVAAGYYMRDENGAYLGNAEPNGFTAENRILDFGWTAYTGSGRSQITKVQFNDQFDASTGVYSSDLEIGQVYEVTLDGVTYSHTADDYDLMDVRTDAAGGHYRDGIYEDLAAQIVASGHFTVQQSKFYRVAGGPDTWIYQLVVTRNVGNTPFTASVTVPFGLTSTVTIL